MGSRRKKKAPQKDTSTPAPKTIACANCGDSIIVPKQCKHGKKLVNCQGTGCSTAHIMDHNKQCQYQGTKVHGKKACKQPDVINKQREVSSLLLLQELNNVEKIRGKEMRYFDGIPKAEFLRSVNTMSLDQAIMVGRRLKEVAQGTLDPVRAMYDDDDSDSDEDPCKTPPEEDQGL
ncbi:hypothetical protein HRR83_005760 [Exophiala dermatitidis]|uniref:Uncharacterized protein n=2 Tax=Exophiala dermatitidis TaxID=5970 RepID=H6BV68_EXODN|nr:uncharacterized protein HMPREF1120_03140 [Exophiala dermatitidis NIH/UT8656]KAJ4508668.1 hypothetical protein HRR73_007335 [Exophiala dermatitidis]EHY54982.1 hypothetical protein HMPREF1120_03140 [Exophiala dermatitidis NIH/UT8656]KAJ4510919.1 hypothetical protein HRR75_005613 [Exophiala dermatitidis]KAJ4513316.1 hypothetical protein HRR74_006128 [Exophiala dermatitidis]KAJ4538133.1 hypothetical protein HRR77_007173 [Exophiala dermatitidis]